MGRAWDLFTEGGVQEGDHLGAVADGGCAELGGGQTAGDAVGLCPEDGLFVPASGGDVGEGILTGDGGLAPGRPEEGDHRRPVAGGQGAEMGGVRAGGDALLHRPEDGLFTEAALGHIGEGVDGAPGLGTAGGRPQEGDHLRPVAGLSGAEMGGIRTGGDALLHRPEDGDVEEAARRDIREGVMGQGDRHGQHLRQRRSLLTQLPGAQGEGGLAADDPLLCPEAQTGNSFPGGDGAAVGEGQLHRAGLLPVCKGMGSGLQPGKDQLTFVILHPEDAVGSRPLIGHIHTAHIVIAGGDSGSDGIQATPVGDDLHGVDENLLPDGLGGKFRAQGIGADLRIGVQTAHRPDPLREISQTVDRAAAQHIHHPQLHNVIPPDT